MRRLTATAMLIALLGGLYWWTSTYRERQGSTCRDSGGVPTYHQIAGRSEHFECLRPHK